MQAYRIRRSELQGTLKTPSSKSHTLRSLVFALMAKGTSRIERYLHSPDTSAMVRAIQSLGATVKQTPSVLEVIGTDGNLSFEDSLIDAGNSGQVLRFIGALAPLSPACTRITGDHSIQNNRPVKPLLEALLQLGAVATSTKGFAPITVQGPLKPGRATLEGQDSQPVSGLLIAASFLRGKTELFVINPGEKPWIDLTLHWLDKFGIKYTNDNYKHYTLEGSASYGGFNYSVPGDFSSAAYPIAAALVTNSEITLENIEMKDVQGDKELIKILVRMGAHIEINERKKTLTVKKNSSLKGGKIDCNDFIDALPILAVLGCFCQGEVVLANASIARKKESDRIHSIVTELKKMGAAIEETSDGLIVKPSSLTGSFLTSYKDHRIALSLAVAALGASGDTVIEDVECINKTYPTFAKDFQKLGSFLEEITL